MTYEETLAAQLAYCEKELAALAYDERPVAHERREALLAEVALLHTLLGEPVEEDSA